MCLFSFGFFIYTRLAWFLLFPCIEKHRLIIKAPIFFSVRRTCFLSNNARPRISRVLFRYPRFHRCLVFYSHFSYRNLCQCLRSPPPNAPEFFPRCHRIIYWPNFPLLILRPRASPPLKPIRTSEAKISGLVSQYFSHFRFFFWRNFLVGHCVIVPKTFSCLFAAF